MTEIEIGRVSHYFPKAHAAAIEIERGNLRVGDTIRIVGHGHAVTQKIESLQIDHRPIEKARRGSDVGVHVDLAVHEKDRVFKLKPSLWELMPFMGNPVPAVQ